MIKREGERVRQLLIILDESDNPKVKKISDALLRAIRDGRLKPGEKLPSSRALAQDLGVHRQTVMAAIENLVSEGWVQTETRRGYLVAQILPTAFFPTEAKNKSQISNKIPSVSMIMRKLGQDPAAVENEGGTNKEFIYDFRSGRPDLRLFPIEELKDALTESLLKKKHSILGYGHQAGYPPFLKELESYLSRVRSLQDRELFVTHGCQEAIYLSARMILKAGDHVAVEHLSYPGALQTFLNVGALLTPIEMDDEGIIPESFEKACRESDVKLLFLTPNHQYPTTVTMSSSRRKMIYSIAASHAVIILEDDFDHEYHFRESPPAPIAANDPEGLVIYVSTFSKIMFPAARIGFMSLPKGVISRVAHLKEIVSIQNNTLMQQAIASWMRTGGAMRHLNRTRRLYEERLDVLENLLKTETTQGTKLEWRRPEGGMAVWLKTPWNTRELSKRLATNGIGIHFEETSRIDGEMGRHLRIGFARHDEKELREGMERLFELAREEPIAFND